MNVKSWDCENDILETNAKIYLTAHNTYCSKKAFKWAYSINTSVGLFRRSDQKTVQVKHEIGNGITLIFPQSLPINLLLDDGSKCITILENVTIWATKFFEKFMVVSSNVSGETFIIDSRGELFKLEGVFYRERFGSGGKVEIDKKNSCYLIEGVKVYYRNKEQRMEFEKNIQSIEGSAFNKEFNKFVRKNAKNEEKYLYLTAGASKCGAFISYFASQGMKYEVLPNVLIDDETLNVRIPLDEENYRRDDVQFLCAKYSDTYAIYGVPYDEIGGGLELSEKHKQKLRALNFYMPNGKEAMVFSVINTLRVACNVSDDYEVYKKTLAKAVRLIDRGDTCKKSTKFLSKSVMMQYESKVLADMAATGLKISKWKNESNLFAVVHKEFPDAIYQYHSKWLGLQSLDIYIPSLKVAIEYQGEQHYHPVKFFGGEKTFEELVERDARKQKLCQANGVKLICWKYDEVISRNRLLKKINDVIEHEVVNEFNYIRIEEN